MADGAPPITPAASHDLWTLYEGDCVDVMRALPAASVDVILTDPPYGIEFMGREWDSFRIDDPGTNRNRGERVGAQGMIVPPEERGARRATVACGGGKRPTTYRCQGCGRRDQFRNQHDCPDGTRWRQEPIDQHAAPPSSLAFQEWCRAWGLAALHVLKPGGHLVAFGAPRLYHRLAAGLEDAGFEVRDCLAWMYGSGFPKSMDVAKAIGKAGHGEDAAAAWEGWGTCLKPAYEPAIVCRKPIEEPNIAGQVLATGTGALHIDAARLPMSDADREQFAEGSAAWARRDERHAEGRKIANVYGTYGAAVASSAHPAGRWPANVALTHHPECRETGVRVVGGDPRADAPRAPGAKRPAGFGNVGAPSGGGPPVGPLYGAEAVTAYDCHPDCPVGRLDTQAGQKGGGYGWSGGATGAAVHGTDGWGTLNRGTGEVCGYGYSGGPSRFYYTSKASTAERAGSKHPTVKPLDLMEWLVDLTCPPGGVVLDPFAGSGTTLVAAIRRNQQCIGIEREPEHVADVQARILALAAETQLDLGAARTGWAARGKAAPGPASGLDGLEEFTQVGGHARQALDGDPPPPPARRGAAE